ncbi:serine/threonine protein phosphatase [Phenylobacterium sp. J426]|uniref:metallophosphoesterase family protein n=1 Tax=Phenylobacterium sp. J426 TaxID=2898439 RepID=UPI00215110C1|nr:metallophosphoesterase family protein [Phenylobacterium sp. J426]MCR5874448.1 serine/threonine protein phosphatase [Phenylobacterium sp. J426]
MSATTDGELVYAVGDVHGCYDLMKALLAKIAADSAARAEGRRPILIFLGDYVDRGPQSAKVIEALIWLKRRPDLEVRLLKGNHEQAMLAFLDAPEANRAWLDWGGAETLAAYGVTPPARGEDPLAVIQARDALLERMPASHLLLLQRLELMVAVGGYAFVHAGVRPGAALAQQTEQDLLWIREGFLDAAGPHEKVIVHGHTWLDERPQLTEHRLGIDTGAYRTGVLTALRLDGAERECLQVGEAWVRSEAQRS